MDIRKTLLALGEIKPVVGDEFHPMREAEIAEVESAIKAALPDGYRRFLMQFGAIGLPTDTEYRPSSTLPASLASNGAGSIDLFYGSADDDVYSLRSHLGSIRDRMPPGFLPIGSTFFGDQICLGTSVRDGNRIFYWDHHNDRTEQDYIDDGLPVPPDVRYQNVTLIADSFEAFLDRLYVKPAD